MTKSAEIIKMPARAKRSAKPAKAKRLNTIEVIRKDVLDIKQSDVRDILGYRSDRAVYEMEKADDDRITIDQIRKLRDYARANDIPWSTNLVEKLLDHDPEGGESPIKRRKAKASEG